MSSASGPCVRVARTLILKRSNIAEVALAIAPSDVASDMRDVASDNEVRFFFTAATGQHTQQPFKQQTARVITDAPAAL